MAEALPAEVDAERLEEAQTLARAAPHPAALGKVHFGTAGWTDPSLIKCHRFYPRGTNSPEARLSYYASQFPLVEVDATYYSLLSPDVTQAWVERTPEGFCFDIKSHPVLTGHPIDIQRAPKDLAPALRELEPQRPHVYPKQLPDEIREELIERFLRQLEPLSRAGRLGCVMLQFPPWFGATRGNAKYLERLRERLPGLPAAVEFRNRSWLLPERRSRVFELLTANRFSYVVVDEPDVPLGGVPGVLAVTQPELAVVRFHGQNQQGWRRGASVWQRFNYLYTPAELRAWLPAVSELAARATRVHAVFNNCVRDYAVLGAKGLAALVAESQARSS